MATLKEKKRLVIISHLCTANSDTYRNSCELRFVRNWKLDKLYVGQYEIATFEENGQTFEFTNEFDEDDEWY